MPIEKGLNHYICDRNAKHEIYAKEGTPEAGNYRTIKRVRSDGTEQSYVLCDACYQAYKSVSDDADTKFNAFMSEGKDA